MGNPLICTITMPSGNIYDVCDQGARDLIKELMNFREWLGITTSEVEDGSTLNPVTIGGEPVTAVAGDVVSRDSDHKDFIFSSTGVWQDFGELSGLGALAFKDSASGSYTPAGTVSQPSFTGTAVTPAGSISSVKAFKTAGTLPTCLMPTFTVSNGNLTITDGSYTPGSLPEGEDVTPTFTGTEFTPAGTVSQPNFTGTAASITVS